jgi:hypothetical protein
MDTAVQVLGKLLAGFGGCARPERAELVRLWAWLGEDGASRRSLGGCLVARRTAEILIGREPARIAATPAVLPAGGQVVWDRRFRVRGQAGSRVIARGPAGGRRSEGLPAFVSAALPLILGPDGREQVAEVEFTGLAGH